jgi:hypothetical protein
MGCLPNCVAPCATCSSNNPNSCSSCLLGYTYNQQSSSCTPITTCPSGGCYACPLGYSLSNNTCIQCSTSTNCARCNPSNPSRCYTCFNGYYLNISSFACTNCPQTCQTCTSTTNCLTCASGYGLVSQPVSTAGTCVLCQSPCAQCTGSPTTCTSCVSGYSLSGWNCQSNFNFGFFVSLNTNLTFFYNNYQAFLNALVGSNSNFQTVTISSIVSGSVNLTGTISTNNPSNSDAAGTQFYTIKNILSQS